MCTYTHIHKIRYRAAIKKSRFLSADMKRWPRYIVRIKKSNILNKYIVAPIYVKYVGVCAIYSYIAIII